MSLEEVFGRPKAAMPLLLLIPAASHLHQGTGWGEPRAEEPTESRACTGWERSALCLRTFPLRLNLLA